MRGAGRARTEKTPMAETTYHSPLGPLRLREAHGHLTHLDWGAGTCGSGAASRSRSAHHDDSPLLNRAVHQLNAYFFCGLRHFDLPVAPPGTPFQLSVWQQMQAIPVRRYKDLWRDRPLAAQCAASGRHGVRPQSDPDHHSLPPCRRLGRPGRLFRRRRSRYQTMAAGTRGLVRRRPAHPVRCAVTGSRGHPRLAIAAPVFYDIVSTLLRNRPSGRRPVL